jgi:hypothetical protein
MEHRYIQICTYEKWTNSHKTETRVNLLCKIKANELLFVHRGIRNCHFSQIEINANSVVHVVDSIYVAYSTY